MHAELPVFEPGAVLGPAEGVAWVTIADEVVLYRVSDAASLVLNSTAGLLWQCLDGQSRLGEIFDDLAEAFGADRVAVEGDCVPVLERWLAERLVEQVNDV
jgi:coenzyme PQQ synthesis protein D (PqqD)